MSAGMNDALLDQFHRVEEKHWWWAGRRKLLQLLLTDVKAGSILDIGCGTGQTMTFLRKIFPKSHLVGVDPAAAAVRYAKSRGHKEVIRSTAEKLPFPSGSFDVVLFLDVLEHIPHDDQALSEAYRVLKPGGTVIITAPALSFIWSRHDTAQGHQRRYTRHAIRSLAAGSNFKLDFISYFNFFLSPPIIAVRLASRLKPLAFLAEYDNSMNFNVATVSPLNSLLEKIFTTEVGLLEFLRYPLGISVAARLKKPGRKEK